MSVSVALAVAEAEISSWSDHHSAAAAKQRRRPCSAKSRPLFFPSVLQELRVN
jgi:hypothetical protein